MALIGAAVLEEKIFENGGRTTDNGQRTDDGACLYYNLTNEPKGSGELKSRLTTTLSCFIFERGEFKKGTFAANIAAHSSVKLGTHIRVCLYVMRLAAYDFSAFEYHA